MIPRNSIVVYSYEDCYEVGLYKESRDGEELCFWLGFLCELYTSMGKLIVIAPPVLGKW